MKSFKNSENFALAVFRFGLAFVFLWFGFSQLRNPEQWVTFLPGWTSVLPITQTKFILINGFFEVIASVLLMFGVFTRISALLLATHLFGIAFSIGFTATGVRDIGLAVATLVLALLGAGQFSLDYLLQEHENTSL